MSLGLENKIKEKLYQENEYGYKYQNPDAVLDDKEIDYLNRAYGIDTNLHRMCINCQARQVLKYKGSIDADGNPIKGFQVRCDGVPKSLPPGSASAIDRIATKEGIDKNLAIKFIKSTVDPVAWSELMFGFDDENEHWHLRSYQKEQLRCNAKRYVIREGRRSGKTFAVACKLLYLAFNVTIQKGMDINGNVITQGPEILIVTPYQSQIVNIFSEMDSLLRRNPDLMQTCTTGSGGSSLYIKTPQHKFQFDNGASIKGFVSGVGVKADASDAGSLRGQNAHIIYLDEMDMIPDVVLDKVVTPILLTYPNVMLIATSTPIGKRGRFYSYCFERPDFKEDYYPSSVLPAWDKIKNELEKENTQDGFRSEYMAEFVEGAFGVFKPSLVYAARQDYRYTDCDNHSWWHEYAGVKETTELIKVMGIDWNKNAGSEFFVVAYSPSTGKFYSVEASNIQASEFSSDEWKKEVIRLNYKWKPHYIYADEGYGHTIIEDLKILGHTVRAKGRKTKEEVETAKLVDRLVAFNFSQKVELKSPIDGQDIVKTGKEYLVENAIRIFEAGRFAFPEADDALRKQLLNYVVLRRSPTTNKPVYGPENEAIGDHRLDAMMLALAGLNLEYSIYSRNSMPFSSPTLVTKQVLEARYERQEGGEEISPGAALLAAWTSMQVPGYLQVTEIVGDRAKPDKPKHAKPNTVYSAWKEKQENRRSFARKRGHKISRRNGGKPWD